MASKRIKKASTGSRVPVEALYVGGAVVAVGGLWWLWSSARGRHDQAVMQDPAFTPWLILRKIGAVTEDLVEGNTAANQRIVEGGLARIGVTTERIQSDPVVATREMCRVYKEKKAANELADVSGSAAFEARAANVVREFEAMCVSMGYRI